MKKTAAAVFMCVMLLITSVSFCSPHVLFPTAKADEQTLTTDTATKIKAGDVLRFTPEEDGYFILKLTDCESGTVIITDDNGDNVGILSAASNIIYRFLSSVNSYTLTVLPSSQKGFVTVSASTETSRPEFNENLIVSAGEIAEFTLKHGKTNTYLDPESTSVTFKDENIAVCTGLYASGKIINGRDIFSSHISVKGLSVGTTVMVVTLATGTRFEYEFTVSEPENITPESITLNESDKKIYCGDSFVLKAVVEPTNIVDNSVKFSSSDIGIVSVDEYGNVKAENKGKAFVTCTASNGVTAICNIEVIAYPEFNAFNITDGVIIGNTVKCAGAESFALLFGNASSDADIIFYDKNGNKLDGNQTPFSGACVKLEKNGRIFDEAIIYVLGDVDGNGLVAVSDARLVLRQAVGLEKLSDVFVKAAVLSFSSENVTVSDARRVLRAAVGLENTHDWIELLKKPSV